MTRPEIHDVLVGLIRDELGGAEVLPEGALAEHLDSVQRLTLAVAVEDRFEICLDPEDEQRIHTLDDLMDCVEMKLGTTSTNV